MDNTKYHVQIGDVPYNIFNYNRSELQPFIPRLSSGDEEESQFDLLKSETIKGFSGGALQRFYDDDTSAYAIQNMYPIFHDGTLYPVADIQSGTNFFQSDEYYVTAYLVTKLYAFVAVRDYANTTNKVFRISTSDTIQAITLPAQLSGTSASDAKFIVSIVQHGSQIWFAGSTGVALAYLDSVTDTSATSVGSGTVITMSKMISFRGQLYGTDGSQGNEWGAKLFRHTGGTSSRAYAQVGYTGRVNDSRYHDVLVYNNRVILMRNDGMYAYDGIQLIPIEDATDHINDKNYRFARVLKGYLYYFMPDGMYRFNGSLIEKIYDVSEIGYPVASCTGINRLWLAFTNSANSGSSRYDKSLGYDYSSGTNVDARLMCFNGEGIYEYARTPTWTQEASPAFAGRGEVDTIFWFNDKIYMFSKADTVGVSGSGNNRYYTVSTNENGQSGNKSWSLVTSIFDMDFPAVYKLPENIQLILDGYVASNQNIALSYRTSGFDGSTAFTSLGNIQSINELRKHIWKTTAVSDIKLFQVQFKLTGTTDVRYGIKRFILRYLLVPDMKWQWQFVIAAYGDDSYAPLTLADNSEGAQSVLTLRDNIYQIAANHLPTLFVDVDQLDLNEALDDSETGITLNSTKFLKGYDGFIKIDNEIMYWYAKTSTDLTVERGVLGTTAATHADNSKVFILYRAQLSIQNEPIELTDPSPDTTEDKSRNTEISVVLKEV